MRIRACVAMTALAVLALAPAAVAKTKTTVKGAGSSPAAGFVRVNAHGDAAKASGRFTVSSSDSFLGEQKGRVLCVAPFFSDRANVGGRLETPIVQNGFTFTHFFFQVIDGGPNQPDLARTLAVTMETWDRIDRADCGQQWWFDAFWQPPLEDIDAFLMQVRVAGDFDLGVPGT